MKTTKETVSIINNYIERLDPVTERAAYALGYQRAKLNYMPITVHHNRTVQMKNIIKVVSDYYKITITDMMQKTRVQEIVTARHVVMYFARILTPCTLKRIGQIMGWKDHSTVLYSCRTISNLIETDKRIKHEVEEIEKILKYY